MSKKLLHKTQRVYLIFSVVLFVVLAPLFYYFFNKLYIREIDETLLNRKTEFIRHSVDGLKIRDISFWNKWRNNLKIKESNGLQKDSLFFTQRYNPVEQENEPYRALEAPILIEGQSFTLSITVSLLESEDFILSIVLLFLVLSAFTLGGLFLINRKLSVKLWQPFYETLHQIENFEIDKHVLPGLRHSGVEEFNRLNRSIESLIERNVAIFNNQREFVENAAHELQTPIAVFRAKIDTLIQLPGLTKEQANVVGSLNDVISRLDRLNKNLLLLSKIEKQYFKEIDVFSLKNLVNSQLDFFVEQAQQKNIAVRTRFVNDVSLHFNKGLTEIMLNNLLLNAIRHNISGGEVLIVLSDGTLMVENTGKNKKLPADKIFNRFYRSGDSIQGNGLGLALIKKIAELNDWAVEYKFNHDRHSFIVKFF